MIRTHGMPVDESSLAEQLVRSHLLGDWAECRRVAESPFCRKLNGFRATRAHKIDLRMRRLKRPRPDVDIFVTKKLAFMTEGLVLGPRTNDEVRRFSLPLARGH